MNRRKLSAKVIRAIFLKVGIIRAWYIGTKAGIAGYLSFDGKYKVVLIQQDAGYIAAPGYFLLYNALS